jgi:hypothetical protein
MYLADFIKSCGFNPSGTSTKAFFAPVSYFVTVATPDYQNITNPEDLLTITDSHVFEQGKGFHVLNITDETGELQSNAVGEKDGRSFEHIFNGFVPNNDAHNLALLSQMANCPYILIIGEMKQEGMVYRQLGNAFRGAYNSDDNNYTSGMASADRRGTSISFKATGQPHHAPFYTGSIDLHP